MFEKPENREIFALKNLIKIPKKWGIYRPKRKLAVRLICQPDRLAVDRPGRPPTVINMTVGETWSTARSTAQIQRAKLSGPVDRPMCLPDVHKVVHVGRPLGRPALGSVDRAVGRPGLSVTVLGQKLGLKLFLIIL